MDVAQILAELKHERKQTAARLVALSHAVKTLRRLRGVGTRGATLTMKPSVAANRLRGRKAWATRMKNQRAKLAVLRSKKAA